MTTEKLITNPVELAAAYGLPWPADACRCCGGQIVDGRCLGADRCEELHPEWCAGLERCAACGLTDGDHAKACSSRPIGQGEPPELCIDPLCYAAGSRHSHGTALAGLADALSPLAAENARLRSQLAEAREALCQPGAIRCKAGKQAILSVSGTGHDNIAKVVAERDELLAALNRFRDVVDFSEATTHMDVAEIVVHHIRSQAADLSLFRSESDLELTAAMRERDAATEARDEARQSHANQRDAHEQARNDAVAALAGLDALRAEVQRIADNLASVESCYFGCHNAAHANAEALLAALGSTPDTEGEKK